ncbi:hypothetical protein O9929_12960 [Vibrio lentus]|nr:hypothetical protein [Vibrio lentus]
MFDEHIATLKLLIAENGKSPAIRESFMSVGENENRYCTLAQFFTDRFDTQRCRHSRLLLRHVIKLERRRVDGDGKPNLQDIEQHARASTEFLLAALSTD